MTFWRNISPRRAATDFRTVWEQENPHRWRFFVLALVVTLAIFSVMFHEGGRIEPRPPEITYIQTFEPGRSDEEIIASNIENQRLKEQREAERARREALVRERYEQVGRYFGMDIETARARGEAERAAQRRAEEQAAAEVRAQLAQ